ncbi:glycosyltransferase family 2 protein [Akkermansiaceae bacterium]|nr:glycosyltransferase family 2 protein [Akkermansiaceae bacterium]
MKVTIVITTKNRKGDLENALHSVLTQSVHPEVILIDDGSTDGTSEMVAKNFPSVRLVSHENSKGLVVRRNEGAKLATGEIIVSIDDDAAFSTTEVIAQALRSFDDDRIGAVAIPYREPHKENCMLQTAPDTESVWMTSYFIGTAHALRRDLFLQLGGYREALVHQGEENDFAIRLLDAGYGVALAVTDEILHFESPKRDYSRMDFFGARNQLLWVWTYSPRLLLPLQFLGTLIRTICFARSLRRDHNQYSGISAAFREIIKGWPRSPTSWSTFRLFRRLRKKPLCLPELGRFLKQP